MDSAKTALQIAKDDPLAQFNLHFIYKNDKEFKEAVLCLIKASKLGHPSAARELHRGGLDDNMSEEQVVDRLELCKLCCNFGAFDWWDMS